MERVKYFLVHRLELECVFHATTHLMGESPYNLTQGSWNKGVFLLISLTSTVDSTKTLVLSVVPSHQEHSLTPDDQFIDLQP